MRARTPPVAAGLRDSTGAEGADTVAATFRPEARELQCRALADLGTLTANNANMLKREKRDGTIQQDVACSTSGRRQQVF